MMKILVIDKLRLAITDKWRSYGPFNQGLMVFAGVLTTGLVVTTMLFFEQQSELRNLKCLAMNVYHEARGEPSMGQFAVAVVTMNRVESSRYPNDVCRVVYQKGWSSKRKRYVAAFSWTLDRNSDIPEESLAWKNAMAIAEKVYLEEDVRKSKIKGALYYHADYVKPRWASKKLRVAKIGRHIFYK